MAYFRKLLGELLPFLNRKEESKYTVELVTPFEDVRRILPASKYVMYAIGADTSETYPRSVHHFELYRKREDPHTWMGTVPGNTDVYLIGDFLGEDVEEVLLAPTEDLPKFLSGKGPVVAVIAQERLSQGI